MRTQILGKRQTAVNKYLQQTKKVITRRRAFALLALINEQKREVAQLQDFSYTSSILCN